MNLDAVCQRYNSKYTATKVSWNDNARTQGSCWGSNITDARLKGKNGEDFLVVRPRNFDEKIGKVRASDVALLVGSHNNTELQPTTLNTYLDNFAVYGAYVGGGSSSSLSCPRDQHVGIRFQAVFLPVSAGTTEFYPETYNYQTINNNDPKNLVLLCTSQGTFVQQDRRGAQPQYLHKQNLMGLWRNHYLEAMETRHGVSMGQNETEQERRMAQQLGKAVSTVIGIQSMGVGFNRLMTVQVPLAQQPRPSAPSTCTPFSSSNFDAFGSQSLFGGMGMGGMAMNNNASLGMAANDSLFAPPAYPAAPPTSSTFTFQAQQPQSTASISRQRIGDIKVSNYGGASAHAARVSFGSDAGAINRLTVINPARDTGTSITITVQFFFVIPAGSTVSASDVHKAIDVCEEAYKGCSWDGNIMSGNPNTSFMVTPSVLPTTTQWPEPSLIWPTPTPPQPQPQPQPVPTITVPAVVATPVTTAAPKASLFGAAYDPCSGLPANVRSAISTMPLDDNAFNWLHTSVGLQLLESRSSIDGAYHAFRLANDLHLELHGVVSPSALYNMACCLSVAAERQISQYKIANPFATFTSVQSLTQPASSCGGVVAPNLPPLVQATDSVGVIVQKRAKAAANMLLVSVSGGFTNTQHIQTDADLECLKTLEPALFSKAIQLANVMNT